jgi:transcriptional regulator GlxA family with amidase domain
MDRNKPRILGSSGSQKQGQLTHPVLANHQADDLRWVVSNKFWTASGVTAGIDMAAAFVRYWVEKHVGEAKAKGVADEILGVTEVS